MSATSPVPDVFLRKPATQSTETRSLRTSHFKKLLHSINFSGIWFATEEEIAEVTFMVREPITFNGTPKRKAGNFSGL